MRSASSRPPSRSRPAHRCRTKSHSTNLIEHPELVAERIRQFAERVGKENVIAGTDCGMGARIHPELGWGKLEALVEGAQLASRALWGTRAGVR